MQHEEMVEGPKVREVRESSGMSIRQLATKTGVDRTKISRWERGTGVRMIREAIVVANALGCTVEELFGALEEENNAGASNNGHTQRHSE
ncbi:MAG: helix-turn-helix transcriptional regulator [Planctomycetaceae bacterium]|nr:helix-turn-helix transcriptional regulator [Planctomycetaceae bacterium]